MEKDLNSEQSVATQDLNAGAVAQQDLNQSVTGGQDEILADGTKRSEKTVKYEEFEKANEKAKAAEETTRLTQQKLDQSVQQNQVLADRMVQQTATQPKTSMEQAIADLGLIAADLYGEDYVRVMNRKEQIDAANSQQQAQAIANQQFAQSHPDVSEVVGAGIGTRGFLASQELSELLRSKPHLSASAQTPEGAYKLVMEERELKKLQSAENSNQEHQKRVDDATLPLGGSAAGGGGAGDPAGQKIMTREQSLGIREKLARGEPV